MSELVFSNDLNMSPPTPDFLPKRDNITIHHGVSSILYANSKEGSSPQSLLCSCVLPLQPPGPGHLSLEAGRTEGLVSLNLYDREELKSLRKKMY